MIREEIKERASGEGRSASHPTGISSKGGLLKNSRTYTKMNGEVI